MAEELSQALLDAVPARRRALCAALCAMGSEEGIPALVDVLGYARGDVRLAAQRALVALTGLSVPAEQLAWQAALGSKPEAPAIATPR